MKKFFKLSLLIFFILSLFAACAIKNDAAPDVNTSDTNGDSEIIDNNEEENNEIEESPEVPETTTDNEEECEEEEQLPDVVVENDAFRIFSPAPHTNVDNQIVVRGQARVFEAAFQYELEDGHFILASGAAYTSSGAPEWGDFEFVIDFDKTAIKSDMASLILFVGSAKDGSREHELIIPLKVTKEAKDQPKAVIENDAFKIFSPAPHAEVKDHVVVRGLARVYEAVLQYELEDGHNVLASGYATTSNAAPEWGEFEIIIPFDGVANDTAMLILYEESAKDGSRQHELTIPLKVKKDSGNADIVAENDAFKLFTPAPHSEVTNQVVVRGLARVFEAVFQYELEDGHYMLASGVTSASSGAPDWGEFEIVIDFDEVSNDTATLILFTASPKDGSRQHELIIPLMVKK